MLYLDGKIKRGILIEPYLGKDGKTKWLMTRVINGRIRDGGDIPDLLEDESYDFFNKIIKIHVKGLINNNKGGQ
jgi:hypothetical protein